MIKFLRWILLPISLVYTIIVWVRNILYDNGIFKGQSFEIPTIVIGNLAIGGTGKSPMTEYLIRLLQDQYKIATLSRGYGRKTRGFRFVETSSTALEVGDEPLQFKTKFPNITVAVSENRCFGVSKLQSNHDLIILDDAYQHRKLTPGYSILLFDFQSLFRPIITLPTGDFRDNFSATKRADIIVITKCPNHIEPNQKTHIEHLLRKYNTCPIFYTNIGYSQPIGANGEAFSTDLCNLDIILFCGIANPTPLVEYLEGLQNNIQLIQFADHHNYREEDFDKIIKAYQTSNSTQKIILTTEKDMQRVDKQKFANLPLFYIPIHLQSSDHQDITLDHFIENYIKSVNKH